MEVTKNATNRWVDKEELVHVEMEYLLGKKNETVPFATPYMSLEVITQLVVSQKVKDTDPMISLRGVT